MTAKTLDARREALEESFFRKENEKLLERLRRKEEREHEREALGEAMEYHEHAVLDKLIDAGLRAETWLAVALVPLVEVAWADREVSHAERALILEAAEQSGIRAGGDARALLEQWLEDRPPPRLREAWKAYVSAIKESFGSTELDEFHQDTLERARAVAKAANHLLGFGFMISAAENAVLEDLDSAF